MKYLANWYDFSLRPVLTVLHSHLKRNQDQREVFYGNERKFSFFLDPNYRQPTTLSDSGKSIADDAQCIVFHFWHSYRFSILLTKHNIWKYIKVIRYHMLLGKSSAARTIYKSIWNSTGFATTILPWIKSILACCYFPRFQLQLLQTPQLGFLGLNQILVLSPIDLVHCFQSFLGFLRHLSLLLLQTPQTHFISRWWMRRTRY